MSAIKFIPEKDVILVPIMNNINNDNNINNNDNNNTTTSTTTNNHTIMIIGIATAITIAIAVFSIIRKNTKSKNELIRFS